MTRNRPLSLITLAALVALVALVVAGCGGGGDQATAASPAAAGSSHTIAVSDNDDLGKILVNSAGHIVYLFNKDTGSKSMCSGGGAAEWAPVPSGKPTARTRGTAG